jgi:predicted HTH domain antitoxin
MPESSVSVSEAARYLDVPPEDARKLADAEGNVPLETLRSRA